MLKGEIGIDVSVGQEQFGELCQIFIALQQLSEILTFVLSERGASQGSDSDQRERKAHDGRLEARKTPGINYSTIRRLLIHSISAPRPESKDD